MKKHFNIVLNEYSQDNLEMKETMKKNNEIIERFDQIISEKASKHSLKVKERDIQLKLDKVIYDSDSFQKHCKYAS